MSSSLRCPLALACVAAAAALTSIGCAGERPDASRSPLPTRTLTVLTPHNENVRSAFATAFDSWHRDNHEAHVDIEWIMRGTPECVRYVDAIFTKPSDEAPRTHPDVLFGGGVDEHAYLADRGRSRPLRLDAVEDVPDELAGLQLRDAQGRWVATGLTSFGIVFNEHACHGRDIAPPATWADLAEPRFFGWIAIASPDQSGSNRRCMTLVLQQRGWKQGWATLVRVLGNARAVVDSSSDSLALVETGLSLAAFSANSDGLSLAAGSEGKIKYVDPPNATAMSPDLMSVLACASEPTIGERFVQYCLSDEGQALWGVRMEQRDLLLPTLYHYPISRRTYPQYADGMAVAENPFERDFGMRVDADLSRRQADAVVPMVAAACGENHLMLQRAWKAVIDAGLPAGPLAELTAPPVDEAQAYRAGESYRQGDPLAAAELVRDWSVLFREKYTRVLSMLGG